MRVRAWEFEPHGYIGVLTQCSTACETTDPGADDDDLEFFLRSRDGHCGFVKC